MPELHSVDGELIEGVPAEFALYPFGVFTTFVVVEGSVLGWGEHVRRLTQDVWTLWSHVLDQARLRRVVRTHVEQLHGPASMRVTLYPEGLRMALPMEAHGCRILVSSGPTQFPFVPMSDFTVRAIEYERELADVKSTALFSQIRLRREAQLAGYDDVLFRRGDEVLEGATWTVLSWREGEVASPRDGVLESITAGYLGHLAEELGWRFQRRIVSLEELGEADLVLAVNAICPARAVRRIGEVPLAADDNLLAAIAKSYSTLPRDLVAGSRRPGRSCS